MKIFQTEKLKLLQSNRTLLLSMVSFITVLLIFFNVTFLDSALLGAAAFLTYVLINGNFLGQAFFRNEHLYLQFLFGILLLILILGFVGWIAVITYNLDTVRTLIVLLIVAFLSLFAKLKLKHIQTPKRKSISKQSNFSAKFSFVSIFYLFTTGLAFYLLIISRADEVHTVWEAMHPLFLPAFFASTLTLLVTIFSSGKTSYKLIMLFINSILSNVLFVAVFPAADIGYQATILGATRLVYDNAVIGGLPPTPANNILLQIWYWFRGTNFQAALSVIFARTFGVDVYWSNALLVPILWGIFVSLAAFLVAEALSGSEKIGLLSALSVSVFPYTIYYGALSYPNSLGFLFFFFSLFFMLRYLSKNERGSLYWVIIFSFFSFLSHFLTGIMSISLLFLVYALKTYESEKVKSPIPAKLLLLVSFAFSVSLIPLALVYQKLFVPYTTRFSLDVLNESPVDRIIPQLLIGEHVNFGIIAVTVLGLSPVLGFLGMLYYWRTSGKSKLKKSSHLYFHFLLLSLLVILIDYRIVKYFMVNVPFNAERFWVFRDLIAIPFVAIIVERSLTYLHKKSSHVIHRIFSKRLLTPVNYRHFKSAAKYISVLTTIGPYLIACIAIPAWVTISVYYGYPHFAPLQATSYEVEAVKLIDKNTVDKYVVIGDSWILTTGQMFVGIANPRAYYFSPTSPKAMELFIEMKINASIETMKEAMTYNNATIAYFIIQKPRLGAQEYNRIIQQAEQNDLQTYLDGIFYYNDEEKLRIFYYQSQ